MSGQNNSAWRRAKWGAGVLALVVVSGCASLPDGASRDPRDPWEGYNRSMFRFNEAVDTAVLKPVATAYRDVVPQPVRTGVGNFFGNLSDAWSFVNNVLQAKPEGAMSSFWRVVINSTMGLGGVLDPATEMRLERRREDFGQTLGRWGVPDGPYFVLPVLGPSTVRDSAALPVDSYGSPIGHVSDVAVRNSLYGVQAVNTRANVLGATELLESAALDPYTFQRDAYLQKRRNDIHDGNPPEDEERYDLEEGETPTADAPAPAASGAAPALAPTRAPRRVLRRPGARTAPNAPAAAASAVPAAPAPSASQPAPVK